MKINKFDGTEKLGNSCNLADNRQGMNTNGRFVINPPSITDGQNVKNGGIRKKNKKKVWKYMGSSSDC